MHELNPSKSTEVSFALAFGMIQKALLKPLLELELPQLHLTGLLEPIGGDAHNQHRRVDIIGSLVAHDLVHRFFPQQRKLHLYIEEAHRWVDRRGVQADAKAIPNHYIVIDPLDGTSDIGKKPYQAVGVVVTDGFGQLQAATVTGIRRDDMLVVAPRRANLYRFESMDKPFRPLSVNLELKRIRAPIRMSTLKRRFEEDQWVQDALDGKRVLNRLDTFGGYALLALLNGEVDAVWDPRKGQNAYETIVWGMPAQEVGCPVTDMNGARLDYLDLIRRSHLMDTAQMRTKICISRDPRIQNRVLRLGINATNQIPLAI